MGLCAICCREQPAQEQERAVRPLLLDLEWQLDEIGDHDLTLEELINLWRECALKNKGKLSEDESKLIEATARSKWVLMDEDESGKVSWAEFVSFAMGGKGQGPLRTMRGQINQALKKDPQKLQVVLERFKLWDKNNDGYVTGAELENFVKDVATGATREDTIQPVGCGCTQRCSGLSKPSQPALGELATQLKEELVTVDVNGDGKLDLWEVTAWVSGRRKTPVELLLYDVSKGASKWLGPLLLARQDMETFHSGVFVYGSEYWYGGKIFRTDPPCTEHFGDPLRSARNGLKFEDSESNPKLKVVRVGYTFVTHSEFVKFIREKLQDRYTGVEKYDLLTFSCNHFADEVLNFLLGHGVPEQVLALQKMALTPAVKAMRPYLNKYLGGFSGHEGGGDQLEQDGKVKGTEKVNAGEILGHGEVVVLDGAEAGLGPNCCNIVATVVSETGDLCEVKFFDPDHARVVTRRGVPVSAIKSRVAEASKKAA